MAKKIATVSSVFAACDRLDAANEQWNRDDVRNAIGGGGYVVIDPLIQAWRALKPLREAAPSTPAELLQQVAVSLEAHVTEFTAETETRLAESQAVFERTVSELSERLAALERDLEHKEESLEQAASERTALITQVEEQREATNIISTENAKLVTENDGLAGQLARSEAEHKEAIEKLRRDAKALAKEQMQERRRIGEEHKAALARERKALNEAAEQAENRLMMLLDQERQAAKETTSQLNQQLAESSGNAQRHREEVIEQEGVMRQLTRENEILSAELKDREARCEELVMKLEKEGSRYLNLQRDFDAYKKEHRVSGDLGALQDAVEALQKQVSSKQAK